MKKKSIVITLTILSFSISTLFNNMAYAEVKYPTGPGDTEKTEAELSGYSEEDWAKLNDNNLDYDELADLVHNFNPAIKSAWNSIDSGVADLDTAVDNIKSQKKKMTDLKESAESSGDYAEIINYTMQEIILDKAGKAMSDAKDSLAKPVTLTNRPIRQAESQVTVGVESIMIAYDSLVAQKTTLIQLQSMYQSMYEDYTSMQGLGMATQTEVNKALTNVYSAKSNITTLESSQESLRRSLITMCGWNESSTPVIGSVPESDLTRIDAMNPEVDITKAIGNNYSLITFRHTSYEKSLGTTNAHQLTQAQMEANLRINLDALYQTVLENRTSYQAVTLGYQSAQISKNAYDTQYKLGMISRSQYMGATITYYQKQAAYEAADMTLFQSMETYDWAVAGNCSVE